MRPSPHRIAALALMGACCLGCEVGTDPGIRMVATQATSLAPGYSVPVDLGTLFSGAAGEARDISANGYIVGESEALVASQKPRRATLWTSTAVLNLGVLPGDNWSTATGVNQYAVVVGTSCTGGGNCRPFKYASGTGMIALPRLSSQSAGALSINDAGVAVGHSVVANITHAVKWTAAGQLIDLHPPGALESIAYDISASGIIVGRVRNSSGAFAYAWNPDGTSFTVSPADYEARAISDNALIVGNHINGRWLPPFRWNPVSLFTPVPAPDTTVVVDVSSKERLVGTTLSSAVTWKDGSWGTLSQSGFVISAAAAVNTCGTIAGYANLASGVRRPVKWVRRVCE